MTISGNLAKLRKETHYIFREIPGTWVFCNEIFHNYTFLPSIKTSGLSPLVMVFLLMKYILRHVLKKAFSNGALERHFWRPLSVEASTQLEELQILIQGIQADI
jgi:hypothetical protein